LTACHKPGPCLGYYTAGAWDDSLTGVPALVTIAPIGGILLVTFCVKRKLSHSSSINSKLAKKGKRVIVICGPATPVKDVLLDLGSMLSVFYETKGKNFHCKKKGKQNVLNSDYHFGHIRFFFRNQVR